MKNIMKAWGLMRVLRLVLGIIIIVQGAYSQEWWMIALGGLFTLMPLLNVGCCGTTTCTTNNIKNNKEEEVNYEEVH